MSIDDIANLGPLAPLVGVWEGDKGADAAPAVPDRSIANSDYRERLTLVPTGRVDNHEQVLYGLRYSTTAWRLGADAPFHEELGYWMWDAKNRQVTRCFVVPRGITVIAGGTVEPDARSFELKATRGSLVYGICANPFLDEQFQTIEYRFGVRIEDDGSFHYESDTVMKLPNKDEPFHHVDANTLRRVSEA
ncbi:MAG: heme-binding beta-barrel domain-containing protein [Myxococcota bacterium]